jgi:hypothetical protein
MKVSHAFFSGKPQQAIIVIHKPQQTKTQPSLISKPLPTNNRVFTLSIAPPPPIPTNQTNTQTQNETPSDIPSQPLCANISQKGLDFVTQTQPSSQSISLRTTQDFPTKQNHKAETQTQPQSSKILAHPILSTPKIPQISTTPASSCPPIQHHSTTHTTCISDKPASTPTTDIAVHAVHHKLPNTPIHPKSAISIIHKPIQTQQATITLEFLSLPHPKSPPLLPKNPKPATTQKQTKKSIPTVE